MNLKILVYGNLLKAIEELATKKQPYSDSNSSILEGKTSLVLHKQELKTAAFALPSNTSVKNHGFQSTCIAPTRELAIQIQENFYKYGKYLGLKLAHCMEGNMENNSKS